MKPALKICFTDFWPGFRPDKFWFFKLLSEDYTVTLDEANPDLLIFCDYGVRHLQYKCLKVYYSHEVLSPIKKPLSLNRRLCDYSFSFFGTGGKHMYFSLLVEEDFFQEIRTGVISERLKQIRSTPKTRFCNFVYSNPACQERIEFCKQLMNYKRVDCPGKVLNNQPPFDAHGYQYDEKIKFLSNYKFTIAFENQSTVNYTTEKIIHPLIAGSVPIYMGNPKVAELFNPKSFINGHDFESFDELIRYVEKVDSDDALYAQYSSAQPILPSSPFAAVTESFLRERANQIAKASFGSDKVSRSVLYPLIAAYQFLKFKVNNRLDYTVQRVSKLLPVS
jgi:hypothetical protein